MENKLKKVANFSSWLVIVAMFITIVVLHLQINHTDSQFREYANETNRVINELNKEIMYNRDFIQDNQESIEAIEEEMADHWIAIRGIIASINE